MQVTGVGCLGEQGREQSFPAIATGLFTLLVRDLTKSRCPSLACPSAPGYFFLGTFAFPVSSTWFFSSLRLCAFCHLCPECLPQPSGPSPGLPHTSHASVQAGWGGWGPSGFGARLLGLLCWGYYLVLATLAGCPSHPIILDLHFFVWKTGIMVIVPKAEDCFKIELVSTQNRAWNMAPSSYQPPFPLSSVPLFELFSPLPPLFCSPLFPAEHLGWPPSLFDNSQGPSNTHATTLKISLAEFKAFHFPGQPVLPIYFPYISCPVPDVSA